MDSCCRLTRLYSPRANFDPEAFPWDRGYPRAYIPCMRRSTEDRVSYKLCYPSGKIFSDSKSNYFH